MLQNNISEQQVIRALIRQNEFIDSTIELFKSPDLPKSSDIFTLGEKLFSLMGDPKASHDIDTVIRTAGQIKSCIEFISDSLLQNDVLSNAFWNAKFCILLTEENVSAHDRDNILIQRSLAKLRFNTRNHLRHQCIL